jgi:hypothetical protein
MKGATKNAREAEQSDLSVKLAWLGDPKLGKGKW